VSREPLPATWDLEADVVVVGCGYAGAMTAIAAHDAGAEVLVLEKMPDPGGISVCSAGGIRVTTDSDRALRYLLRTNGGTGGDEVLAALARAMAELPAVAADLAARAGAEVSHRPAEANYPFDGHDAFGFVYVERIEGFDPAAAFPHVRGSPQGALLFEVLRRNLAARGLAPRTGVAARRLLADGDGVAGLVAEEAGREIAVRARRAVVLACGGFEGAPEMQRQFWPAQPVLNAAFRGNTGDGIRMAQALGAGLWHMWHYHGSYGFRHPDPAYPFGIRTKRLPDWMPGSGPRGDALRGDVRMPWILLDRLGRRFMNEYEPYLQDTGARPFDRYLPELQDFAAIPAWLVADAQGHALWPFGRPTSHERGVGYDWSRDNEAEVALGILRRAADLAELAAGTGLPEPALAAALDRWNAACAAGTDADWMRPPTSMVPIRTAPFTYAPVYPIVSNTQGGPVHDARQRILDAHGDPIPRLYAAGEMGSVFGHLYMSGGNIAECFAGGRIAGAGAAAEAAR
jgi:succinate dehydrogenase/fumarate reductase flavoprotein subunit